MDEPVFVFGLNPIDDQVLATEMIRACTSWKTSMDAAENDPQLIRLREQATNHDWAEDLDGAYELMQRAWARTAELGLPAAQRFVEMAFAQSPPPAVAAAHQQLIGGFLLMIEQAAAYPSRTADDRLVDQARAQIRLGVRGIKVPACEALLGQR